MSSSTLRQNLEKIYLKMQEIENKYKFSFPTSLEFDFNQKLYNNSNSPNEDKVIKEMYFELFSYAINLCNYSNSPQIVSDKKFADIKPNENEIFSFNELYRGARKVDNHANILFDENYHVGAGELSNGIFTTPSLAIAFSYTRSDNFSESSPLILKLKLSDVNMANSDTLLKLINSLEIHNLKIDNSTPLEIFELYEFIESISPKENKDKFICALKDNISILASMLRYDCIYDKKFPSIIILNREKIIISTSEANKIIENSLNHKNIKI